MAEEKLHVYRGNCHCAAFVYEVKLPEIEEYTECNCSICHKKGYSWVFPGTPEFVKGSPSDLTDYTFNKGYFHHLFCPNCGTGLLSKHTQMPEGKQYGFNIRAIQGLDIWSLKSKLVDGKALPGSYTAPVYNGPQPGVEVEIGHTYHGSCHCGAATIAVKVAKPLDAWDIAIDEERIVECNCSICVRGAYVWIYLPKAQSTVVVAQGVPGESLAYYVFNNAILRKAFCKRCGVHLFNEANPLTDEQVDALSDYHKAWWTRVQTKRNITLRCLNDFDCSGLRTRKLDGWGLVQPVYQNP